MPDHVSLTGAYHRIKQDALLIWFDLVIHACQLDVTQHFGSSYCYNNIII